MYVMNDTDDYNSFIDCTNIDKEDLKIIFKNLLLSIPGMRNFFYLS